MKKKILAITGIRSEYDILFPVLDMLRKDPQFEVKVIVSGAHLSDWHGNTLDKIKEDGFEIADHIDNLLMTNRNTQRVKGVGLLTYAISQTVEREKPAFLLVVGDREESIATALVGNYMDVLIAHIAGGDPVFGNADDPIRFAVSKLSHIHFTLAQQYAENLKKIGEEDFRVFWVGNPSLDNIKNTRHHSLSELSQFLNFDIENGRYVMFLKHPLSSEKEQSYEQMKVSLMALESFCQKNQFKVVAIHPNTDPGAYDILRAIEDFKGKSFVQFFKTLSREVFVNLMRHTKALVGNSSMGILEAPFYKVPVVNIGNRQKGRLNAGNVEFVSYDHSMIEKAITKGCYDQEYRDYVAQLDNPYGNGQTAEQIRAILASIDLNDQNWYIKKQLFY